MKIIRRKIINLSIVFITLSAMFLPSVTSGKNTDGAFDNFKEHISYDNAFTDVSSSDWYASDVAKAYSYGLISGVSDTEFAPEDKVSKASCIVMAARLHSIYYTGEELLYTSTDTAPWYSDYVKYALDNDIISTKREDYDAYITRAQFIGILAHALPDDALAAINSVEDNSIPDVPPECEYHDEIYQLYRAGVIVGSGDVYKALPDDYIRRSEAAPVLLRMADTSKRQKVTLSSKMTVYNTEGSEKIIAALDYDSSHAEGWYTYPVMTVYAADGRTRTIPASEKDAWLAVNWYDYPVMTVYAADGRTRTIPASEKDAWLAVNWYDCPVTTVYAPDGRTSVIPESEKDAWLAVGWYGSKFISMPQVLSKKGLTTTDIPVISIGTGGKSVSSKTTYVPCLVNIFNVEEDMALSSAKGGIRLRGNASLPAKPYRIKFETKQNMLGLNDGAKAKSWVLLNYPEGAVDSIKNDIAFRMGRMLMEPDGVYCSDARFVHLYLNEGFCGTYLLCEQTQVNKHRVDVSEPQDGYTGTDIGYLVEIDNYSEPPYFTMNYENAYVSDITGKSRRLRSAAYSIKSDVYSQEQKDFIAKYIRGVFQIVYQACEKKNYLTFDENYNVVASNYTTAQEAIDAVVDLQSFVDMYILYEIMNDKDVGEGSFYMCADFSQDSKHPKLTLTAPWDFNWTCMGSAKGAYYASTFCSDSFMRTFGDRSNPWFIILYRQWWFRELVCKKWTQIGGSQGIASCINEETAVLNKYQPDINRKKGISVSSGKYYLNWILERSKWLDSIWLK